MEAKLYGQNKGGMSINGIIKDYYAYAKENISAGDLVEYVNGVAGKTDYGESVDTQLSTNSGAGGAISAVALDENRVFIAHRYVDTYWCLYGIVCTIDGATIIAGTDTALATSADRGNTISTCLLPNGKVFIAHNSTSSYYLYGMVVEINGTTIRKGADTSIRNAGQAGYAISTVALDENRVFIAHSVGANAYNLYGVVCTISDRTITVGEDTVLSETNYTAYVVSACLLPNGNVFIAHSYGTDYYLRGMVVSISGTTITKGGDKAIASTKYAGSGISAITLGNGNVFIAHSYDSYLYLYGVVCTISDRTITVGSDTEIMSTSNAGIRTSTSLLPNGDVFITHSRGTSYNLYGIIVSIDDTTITKGTDKKLNSSTYTGQAISSLLLKNGSIFAAYSSTSSYKLNAQIFGIDYENNIPTNQISIPEYETQVRKVTTGQFDGIAKTSGEGGDDTAHKDIVSIWTKVKEVIPEGTQQVAMADGKQLYDANGDIFVVREAS